MPATWRQQLGINLSVISYWQILDQYFCNRVPSARVAVLYEVETAVAINLLILDVMAEEAPNLDIMIAPNFGKIVLPDEQVLVIHPRRLVPQHVISICPPDKAGIAGSWMRKYCGELGGYFLIERFTGRAGFDEDIIPGSRELELIDRC